MRLKNILFVVSDIEKSKAFYHELFGLDILSDFGGNVIMTEGLVLQEQELWEKALEKKVCVGGHDAELYFEESNMDAFLKKLEDYNFPIEYLSECEENDWGKRVIRIYDPDRHVIEIAEVK